MRVTFSSWREERGSMTATNEKETAVEYLEIDSIVPRARALALAILRLDRM
jgi:hypothetical protein